MKNTKLFANSFYSSFIGAGVMLSFAFGLFAPLSADAAMLYRQLQFGMRGADVSDLQTYLATDVSIYPSRLVTGYYGSLTQAGVQRFQAANNIVNSGTPSSTGYGRVGPITMAAINARMSGGNTGLDRTSPTIGVTSVATSTNSATINWNTNENASAIVYYSTSPISLSEGNPVTIGGTSFLVHADLRSSHAATLSGLQANTTYYYVLYVRDGSGNESITLPGTFRTNQ